MQTQSKLAIGGNLKTKVIRAPGPGLLWHLKNRLRVSYILGWLMVTLAKVFSKLTGIPTLTSQLSIRLIKATGEIINYGVVGYRVVTSAGVAFLVDDWDDDTTDITNMNYHASGTDNTAENSSDTALGAESTTITDRATGTKTQPSANVLQSVGTQSYTGSGAIVEHGLLSVVTEGSGTLWDRTVFSTINVGNGDSIEFTYQCTITAGS